MACFPFTVAVAGLREDHSVALPYARTTRRAAKSSHSTSFDSTCAVASLALRHRQGLIYHAWRLDRVKLRSCVLSDLYATLSGMARRKRQGADGVEGQR